MGNESTKVVIDGKFVNKKIIEKFVVNGVETSWERNTLKNPFTVIRTPAVTLLSLEYLREDFDQFGKDKDTKEFYNFLNSTIETLSSAKEDDKELWDIHIAQLLAKTGEYINSIKAKIAGDAAKQEDLVKYELATSILDIGEAYHKINRTHAKGPVDSVNRYELLTYYDNLETELSQNQEGASKEYKRVIDNLRYLKCITEGFENFDEYNNSRNIFLNNCMAYIVSAADKKFDDAEKHRLDSAIKAMIIVGSQSAEESEYSQRKINEYILSLKVAKENILSWENSDIIELQQEAESHNSSLIDFNSEVNNQTADDFYKSFLQSLSDSQLADYIKLSSAEVKRIYDESRPKHYEPAKEYIEKIKANANAYTRAGDRFNYITNDDIQYASTTKLGLAVSRSAISSLALCMLLKDGYSMEDALSPDKLSDLKKDYGRKAAQLIKENKALEVAKAYMDGCEKLCDYLDDIQLNSFPINPEFMLSEKAMHLSLCSSLCNDISQEMGRGEFREAVNKEIANIRIDNPQEADKLSSDYQHMVDRGAYSAIVPSAIKDLFTALKDYVSKGKQNLAMWSNLVIGRLTALNRTNAIVQDIKEEMQRSGKTYFEIIGEPGIGDPENKYTQAIYSQNAFATKLPQLFDETKNNLKKDPFLADKLIKAFFEGKYNTVISESQYDAQITGFKTLVNELIDERFKEDVIEEQPITLKKYSHNYRTGLVSKKPFTDTVDGFEFLPIGRLMYIESKDILVNARERLLKEFTEDDYREDVDYSQEALDNYFKSHFNQYTALTPEQIQEKKEISDSIRNEFNRAVGARKLNLLISSLGLQNEEKAKISEPFDALFTSDTSDEGIKRNEEIAHILLKGSDADKANLIKERLKELSKIDLSNVYGNMPESMQGHIDDIYTLYSNANKIQSLIDEGAKLGLNLTSDEDCDMLYDLKVRADFALNLKDRLDFICSPAFTGINEECLDQYNENGFNVDDIVKNAAFTNGLKGLVQSEKNVRAEIQCHSVNYSTNSRYFVYQKDENGNLVKGRIVDGAFVPAQFVMDGVVLDTLYKDDLREELRSNIQTIREFCPDFNMSEEEIEEQISDDNINKTYRARAKKKLTEINRSKVNPQFITHQFYKRANTTYIQEHGKDKSALLNSDTAEGDEARKSTIADVYNRVVNLDTSVFDFHGDLSNKDNEGKEMDLVGNPESKNDVAKEKYDKAFDYIMDNYEDLEYAMIVNNSFNTENYGFEIDTRFCPELKTLKYKGEILGGIARIIRENHENKNTLIFPVNKLSVGQIENVVTGIKSKKGSSSELERSLDELKIYIGQGLNCNDYVEEPTKHQYTSEDFQTKRKSLSGLKQSLGSLYGRFLTVNDGSNFFRGEKYKNFVSKHEALLTDLAEIKGEVSEELQKKLCTEAAELRQAVGDLDSAVKTASAEIKKVLNPLITRFNEEVKRFSLTQETMRMSIDSWNKNDKNLSECIAELKFGSGKSVNSNSELVGLSYSFAAGKTIGWERLTSEKDFNLIESEEQALAAIKHLADGLDTTKKDHDEFKILKTVLNTSITNIEKANAENRWTVLQDSLSKIGTAAQNYLIAKPERLKLFGLSERSEGRFEKARDLCMLAGALRGKSLIVAHKEPSEYKKSAMKVLDNYNLALALVSVSGDSREFKRIKEKLSYVKNMVAVSDSEDFIKQQFKSLASESLDYYVKKIDAPLHGTRGKKLDLIRNIIKLKDDCKKNPIPYTANEKTTDDYRFDIALKIAKKGFKNNSQSSDFVKKNEAKLCLSNPDTLLENADQIMRSGFFELAFGSATPQQLQKLAEKSGADLFKMFSQKVPKPAANRPVDAYISKMASFVKSINTAVAVSQYHTDEEGVYFKKNALDYSTERTMLRTYAICELLNKGYKFSDILDPSKLKNEKRFFAEKGMRLVSNAREKGDQAAEELTRVMKNGAAKIVDCLNDLYSKINDFSDANLLTENGKQIIAAGLIAKDINQEIVKGIDMTNADDNLVNEIKILSKKLDTLNKPASACYDYVQSFEQCRSTSMTKIYDKAEKLFISFISQQYINKVFRDMKANPNNAGKTMDEMLNPGLNDAPENKLVLFSNIVPGLKMASDSFVYDLATDIEKNPLICDKYIEANSKGLFNQVEISFNPITMHVSLDKINPLMQNLRGVQKQAEMPKFTAQKSVQNQVKKPEVLEEITEEKPKFTTL